MSITSEEYNESAKYPGASREKFWSELTADEKIERLRQQIKQRDWQLQNAHNLINKISSHFYKHKHDLQTGELLKKINEYENNLLNSVGGLSPGTLNSNPDEVFF